MYVCICNNISSNDLEKDPSLIDKVGSKCGKCIAPNNAQSFIKGVYTCQQEKVLTVKREDVQAKKVSKSCQWLS
jgi:bacterioferritin-associated ferredoxin